MRLSKNLYKRNRLNQDGVAHHILLIALVVLVIGAIGAYVVTNGHAAIDTFSGHCKDGDHVRESVAPGGASLLQAADVEIRVQYATDSMHCINAAAQNYRGPVYTFFVNGKEGMHMLPTNSITGPGAAQEVRDAFYDYGNGGQNVRMEHTDGGSFFVYHDFTAAAALKVANQLASYLNGTPVTVHYINGRCFADADLQTNAAPAGVSLLDASDVSIKVNQATNTLRCSNYDNYRGPVYTFVVNGNEQLDMLTSGATYVKNTFKNLLAANASGNIQIQRRSTGSTLKDYKDFTPQAATKVVTQLTNLGL